MIELAIHNHNRITAGLHPIVNLDRYLRETRKDRGVFIEMVRTKWDWKLFSRELKKKAKREIRIEKKIKVSREAKTIETIRSRTNERSGWVYLIDHPFFPGWIKIGSTLNTDERLGSYQTYAPEGEYRLIDRVFSKDRRKLELAVHEALAPLRGNGEWFRVNTGEAMRALRGTRLVA